MNPYAILGIAALWLASCAGSAWVGWDYRDGKAAQEIKDAQAAEIKDAQDNAVIDMQAAADRARQDALAESAARTAKEKGIRDASLKADPHCVRDPGSISLLESAIRAANGAPGNPGSLPESLPGTGQAQ